MRRVLDARAVLAGRLQRSIVVSALDKMRIRSDVGEKQASGANGRVLGA